MKRSDMKERMVMFSLATFMFLSSIGTSIANVALPHLSRAFSATFSEIQWVIVSYLLTNTVSIVAVGKLGDHFGRQKVLGVGILIFTFSSFICAVSSSLWMMVMGRAIQGIGSATLMALTIALVSDLTPKERIGRTMGLLGTASAIGTAGGPSLGGLILSFVGWPFIFLFLGTLGLGVFFVSYYQLLRVKTPSMLVHRKIDFSALRERSLLRSLILNVSVSTVMMCTLVVGPFYLSRTLLLSTMLVGAVMTVGPLASIISGVPAGRAVDRHGAHKVIMTGLSFLALGCLSFTVLPSRLGAAGYVISAALLSPGYQMFQAGNNSSVMSGVPEEHKGLISGILSLSRNSGLIIGASGMGLVYAKFGMETTFFLAAFIALTALLLASGKFTQQKRTEV